MSVKKKASTRKSVVVKKEPPATSSHCYWTDFCKKIGATLVGILLLYGIVFLGSLIRNNFKAYEFIGQAEKTERTITIEGTGEVAANTDIALVNMGMVTEGVTVAVAQDEHTKGMEALHAKLDELGVAKADVQTTSYNIYPQYNYADGGRTLVGYEISCQVAIKIRDVANASKVLALAGEVGANNVGGLQFTVDDKEVYKTKARDMALKQVATKARALSESLGVQMTGIVAYHEYEAGAGMPVPHGAEFSFDGFGGPPLESGSQDVVLHVQVTFEIR